MLILDSEIKLYGFRLNKILIFDKKFLFSGKRIKAILI
jgi:hypothetical protein